MHSSRPLRGLPLPVTGRIPRDPPGRNGCDGGRGEQVAALRRGLGISSLHTTARGWMHDPLARGDSMAHVLADRKVGATVADGKVLARLDVPESGWVDLTELRTRGEIWLHEALAQRAGTR